jgi:thiol:disulfide interchange protein
LATVSAPALAETTRTGNYTATLNLSAIPAGKSAVLAFVLDLKPGLHAQSHHPNIPDMIAFDVQLDPNPAIDASAAIYPADQIFTISGLGPQPVYTGHVIVYVPFTVKPNAKLGSITLSGKATWQACNENVCFPPQKNATFSVQAQIVDASAAPTTEATTQASILFSNFNSAAPPTPAAPPSASGSETTSSSSTIDFFGWSFAIGNSNFVLALVVALVVGLIFNLMPCVLPVIPLKAIGFLEVSKQNRARCFLLGVVFSLGLLTIFALLAVLIVVLRKFSWGEQFRYGAFIWVMVAILVIMALGMFGLFDVVLPDSIYNLTPSHESLVGNFLFGMLAAVLSTPCTAPMFAGLLAWALAAPATLGFLVVITIGIGMALPYLLLSAFPELAKRVPRTGPWSLVLKQMMGFFLLAVAVYFAGGRILSREDFFWSVFAVIAASMIFLVVRTIQLTPRWRPVLISIVVASGSTALALLLTLRLLGGLVWQPFTAETLAAARSSDKPDGRLQSDQLSRDMDADVWTAAVATALGDAAMICLNWLRR